MATFSRGVRPIGDNQFFWFDSELNRAGVCAREDWPVEWEGESKPTLLIAPASLVVHGSVEVPKAVAKSSDAVLFAYEDNLNQDVTDLHSATVIDASEPSIEGDVLVRLRAVSKEWIREWFDYFNTQGAPVGGIVSEADQLMPAPDELIVGPSCIWWQDGSLVAVDYQTLSVLQQSNLLPSFRKIKRVVYATVEPEAIDNLFSTTTELQELSLNLNEDTINLATESFSASVDWGKKLKHFKAIAAALALLFVVDYSALAYERYQLAQQGQDIRAAQLEVYRSVQPAGSAPNPYAMLESMIVNSGAMPASDLARVIAHYDQVTKGQKISLSRIESVSASSGAVFTVSASSLNVFDSIQRAAQEQGIDLTIEQQRMAGGRGDARIRIH